MKILGVLLEVGEKAKVETSIIEVEKETPKLYKLANNNDSIFNYCSVIQKDVIGEIQKGRYGGISRHIWVIDDGTQTVESLIKKLKDDVIFELEQKTSEINRKISALNNL